jgi:nucleotide-binding universal stress UspA family protein
MTHATAPERFVIVAGIDDSPMAEDVVTAASGFARMVMGAEIHLVYVVEDLRTPNPELPVWRSGVTSVLEEARELLDRWAEKAKGACAARVSGHVAMGTPWREIVQMATHLHADLVLVGTHGRKGLARLVLGSVAETVVRKALCPVLVVRKKEYLYKVDPQIEPACSDCLVVQRETSGKKLWCARHAEHHPHGHTHYEMPQSFGEGSSLLRP